MNGSEFDDVMSQVPEEDADLAGASSPADILEDIRRLRANQDAAYLQVASQPGYADKLSDAARFFLMEPEVFAPGDLVTWKPLLKNRRYPAAGFPAVVVETHPGRKWPVDQTSSPYYDEPADIVLGILDGDEEFEVYPFDVRRFAHWKPTD
ncbi:hypothetical protein CH273_02165 [Rhodococcus sp. 05-339-2]|uniref:hypothetical protein n=1 Tax=Rhodococcoides fascians TaxID=1828 RepID=UPI00068E2E20|nr:MULTISPECIES: hypothetical protein [Rhodococcus]OZD85585.1 hypothetical protein CH273_02165 [Rhodococcus sp. 05-339-2]